MATKLGRIVAYHEGFPNYKVTQRPGPRGKQKCYIATTRVPMATNLAE